MIFKNSLKLTRLIVRLKAGSEEKSIASSGKQLFQILTARSVKDEDLTVLVHWHLNNL